MIVVMMNIVLAILRKDKIRKLADLCDLTCNRRWFHQSLNISFMNITNTVNLRTGAKSLKDVEIPDASWKPDFDLADRYQCFANELMRIALLGIAGYGFLIKELCGKGNRMESGLANCLWIGAVCLCLSLTLVLAHRFLSTSCLYCQILIMRSLKRLDNSHWTEVEKDNERKFLDNTRNAQKKKSKFSHFVLVSAATFFATGFIFVIAVFHNLLLTISK